MRHSPRAWRGRSRSRTTPFARRLGRGAVAGAIGWWAMDQALQFMYDQQSAPLRAREDRARGGIPALEVLAEEIAGEAGVVLNGDQRRSGGTIMQWTTGVGTGVVYGAVREKLRGSATAKGLSYGASIWLLVDETLTPLVGLSPGPFAFPWQTHARGCVGHLVFGLVTEAVMVAWETASGDTNQRFFVA